MSLAKTYGKLPHELLELDIDKFSFDLAITMVGNQKLSENQKNNSSEKKNEFAGDTDSADHQFTQKEFEQLFKVQ